ncbi:uncharacterized protein E0L32_002885 [Thyridium curvatum]|uniref:Carboxylic ester hydrolase n=1 Tax=Thyridium curvatum TaxID=1093900 RepID=A0A507BG89_9PEZI|nr:uncharacterized protein E0L32_002885 [Thyridium curvatum]TPX17784.1 hypothetical protein E0L32_002885 [Thyridium curvatum]
MGSVPEERNRPLVRLPQGQILGIRKEEALPRPVDAFLGVPYAQPPTGDRRFRAPAKLPSAPDSIVDASAYGPAAPGKPLFVNAPKLEYSEDCLTANIFRPSSNGASTSQKLPVTVYVHGGAFNRGSSSMHNSASMLAHSANDFIIVSFNYRLGALGFLPSAVSLKEGAVNLGLHDQLHLLQWVQDNIEAFGGDPSKVTLLGLSAGAHSIGHLLMSYKEGVAPLFHRVIIESGAPTSRAVRPYNSAIHEEQFQDFLREVKAPEGLAEDEIFPFLRKVPYDVITAAQTAVFDKYNPSLRWAFQPVIDGDVIMRPPLETWKLGKWHKVPIITGFTTNEGSLYVNKQMNTSAEFRAFFAKLLPLLSQEELDTLCHLYPDPEVSPEYKEERTTVGSQYKRVEAAYAHYAYVAPSRQTALYAAPSVPVYLYHWALVSTVENRAQHGDNMAYETCDPAVTARSPSQKELALSFNRYLTNFIVSGDPNSPAAGPADQPRWEALKVEAPRAMAFGLGNEEKIGGQTGPAATFADDTWGRKECEFWWSKVELSQQ